MSDDVAELLRAMLGELRAIREALERPAVTGSAPRDPKATAALLRAIRRAVRPVFSVHELLDRAEKSDDEGEALRAAILAAVGALNGRKLGRFLSKIAGRDIGGYVVTRLEEDRDGVVWMLSDVDPPGFETRETRSRDGSMRR